MTCRLRHFLVCILLVTAGTPVVAHDDNGVKPPVPASPENTRSLTQFHRFNMGFEFRTWLSNLGTMGRYAWLDSPPNGFGLEYPLNSGIEHLFAAGPWIGAIVDTSTTGTPKVVRAVSTGYEGWSGPLQEMFGNPDGRDSFMLTSIHEISTPNRVGFDDDGDGKLDEDELDGYDNDGDWNPASDDLGTDGLPDTLEFGCTGGFDPVDNPDPAYDNWDSTSVDSCGAGIPFKSNRLIYTQRNGFPNHGEPHVDEDFAAISEMDAYVSFSDFYGAPSPVPGHTPLGIKCWQRAYAWSPTYLPYPILFLDLKIVNTGRYDLDSVFIGMLADYDVGPTSSNGYYARNVVLYDSLTFTSYVVNPVDRPSTPGGLTLLDPGRGMDSLTFTSWWMYGSDSPSPDRNRYDFMKLGAIRPALNISDPGDVRFLTGFGPFASERGDTLHAAWAFVSGSTSQDLKENANRARQIYSAGYFLPPLVSVMDSGTGSGLLIRWNHPGNSASGAVAGYHVVYAATDQFDEDTITVTASECAITGLTPGKSYYVVVSAVDAMNNVSVPSPHMFVTMAAGNTPMPPSRLTIANSQRSICVRWPPSNQLDVRRWNIYRSDSRDTTVRRLNADPLPYSYYGYCDADVWGDRIYCYRMTSLDDEGNESAFSEMASGTLPAPSAPIVGFVTPGKTTIALEWTFGGYDDDVEGYNVYRSTDSTAAFEQRNPTLITLPHYRDSVETPGTYYYYIRAVDSTDAVSPPSEVVSARTIPLDRGILVVNAVAAALRESRASFYEQLLEGYGYTMLDAFDVASNASVYRLGDYSTVLWLQDGPVSGITVGTGDATAMTSYVLGGGKLLVMKPGIADALNPPSMYSLVDKVFGTSQSYTLQGTDFVGAIGQGDNPTVMTDAVKLASTGGKLSNVNLFPFAMPEYTTHTYKSDPYNWLIDGLPVGLKAPDSTLHALYLGFPLYPLDSASASALLRKILGDFSEVTDVYEANKRIPLEYRLHQAYPNPFNPSTSIRYELPLASTVNLTVYDIVGREVATLVQGQQEAGYYETVWNAASLASGIYFYRMDATSASGPARSYTRVGKVMLVK
jgi:hypothetical protein